MLEILMSSATFWVFYFVTHFGLCSLDEKGKMIKMNVIPQEKKTEIETTYTDAGSLQGRELDPDIVELCEGIGQVLKKYRQVEIS